MHTDGRRPLNARDAKSYEKKNILYIYIFCCALRPLVEFPVGGNECPGTPGTNSYRNEEAADTPPPPRSLTKVLFGRHRFLPRPLSRNSSLMRQTYLELRRLMSDSKKGRIVSL
jgi:hypothetical protein